jgi:hypothetical protein
MTEKYFKLREDLSINVDEKTLYRIEALQDLDIHGVKKGDLGGYIEKESNLSGNAWVFDNAKVYGDARVHESAKVYGNARVFNDADVSWYAEVSGDAQVSDSARVHGNNARVSGNARVFGDADVSGNTQVLGDATVSGHGSLWDEIVDLLKVNNKRVNDIGKIHLRGHRMSTQMAESVLSKVSLGILELEHEKHTKKYGRDDEGLYLNLIISGDGFIIRSDESYEYYGTYDGYATATYQGTFLDYVDLPETPELPKESVLRKMKDAKNYTENVNLFYQLWD